MKIHFSGYRRSVTNHEHEVKSFACKGLDVKGVVFDLKLTGDFNCTLSFSADDISKLMASYIESNPEEALNLICKMQSKAIISLLQTLKIKMNNPDTAKN